ncbi:MAG: ABC transporter ATP-binding protein [Proteobacteria bacterium]|nr:ABC transporter ATP-binding protein [Pseudomonadota bacterium]
MPAVATHSNEASARATGHPLLSVDNLSVTLSSPRGPVQAVLDVSYRIQAGRTLGVVGESGCGKTMTALALLGQLPATAERSGSIVFEGRDLSRISAEAMRGLLGDRLAMIYQEPMTSLNPVMPVGDQVAEVLVIHRGLTWPQAREAAVGLLAEVRIPAPRERGRSYPHELSGGMRQRVMIATALACRPTLLIADEPTTALDVTIQAQLLELMLELQERLGMAIQFISHNLAAVSEMADEIMVMYAGRIVERADAAALFAAPRHPYTVGLIGTIPDLARRRTRLPMIPGVVPNPARERQGCAFADRCPIAGPECREHEPELRPVATRHEAACFKAVV